MDLKQGFIEFIEKYQQVSQTYAKDFLEDLDRFSHICIWGAGEQGRKFIDIVKNDVKIDFICDNNASKWGIEIDKIPCISPQELEQYKNDVVIIVPTGHHISVVQQLKEAGYKNIKVILSLLAFKNNLLYCAYPNKLEEMKQNVLALMEICADYKSQVIIFELIKNWFANQNPDNTSYRRLCVGEQYFDKEIIALGDKEVFVDIGAWDGDTIFSFLRKQQNKFEKIHAFELDKNNYLQLQENIGLLNDEVKNKIALYNIGAWNKKEKIFYDEFGTGSKITNDVESQTGLVDRLDDILYNQNVTLIKMDIEGAEINALEGAKNMIRQQQPKMAICVYHEPEHLWKIPLYLKKLVPNYKIYIRHYQMDEYETVCYAIK